MRIINITAYIDHSYDDDVFQLKCGDTVLIQEQAPYGSDNDDLEQWAAQKLKGLFQ